MLRILFLSYWTTMAFLMSETEALGYTASKVWFEFLQGGRYRVTVAYTVPELKEFRESYVEFVQKKVAEKYYWDLVRGADFFPADPANLRFIKPPSVPDPW